MKLWLRRFNPRNWVQISTEDAQHHPYYGLRGRLLYVLMSLFLLSSLTLVIERVLSVEHVALHQTHYNNTIIFFISLSIAYGIFTKRWWTRYLSYTMFSLTLGSLLLYYQANENFAGTTSAPELFGWSLALLLVRDLPLCLYLTLSRRARMTLERQAFYFDKYSEQQRRKAL